MEMVSAKAILYNNKNTESLLEIHPDEQPVSLQFFGSDPKIMSEMAKRVVGRVPGAWHCQTFAESSHRACT